MVPKPLDKAVCPQLSHSALHVGVEVTWQEFIPCDTLSTDSLQEG